MNLFDIMRSAGGGEAFAALARQYGLSEQEIAKAVEVFSPALSAGLKRSTAHPLGLMELMRRLALADYVRAYENPLWAAGEGRREGEDALAFLFGSQEMSRALAEQAAAFTGLAQETLRELMPALAAMTFGGLAEKSAATNPVLDAWLKEIRARAAEKPAAKGPLDRLEEEEARREAEDAADATLRRRQEEMMRAGLAAFQAGTAAWQEAMREAGERMTGGAPRSDAARPETQSSASDVFGEMFEPGLRLSEAYLKEIEALLKRSRPETKRS